MRRSLLDPGFPLFVWPMIQIEHLGIWLEDLDDCLDLER